MTEYSVSAAPWGLLFTQGATVTLTLSSAGATAYTVTDVYGTTYTGAISSTATSFTPTPPSGGWANGWYSVDITGPSGYYACTSFVVVNDDPRFPAIPAWGVYMNASGQLDQPLGHYLGFSVPNRLFQRVPYGPAQDIAYVNDDLRFVAPLLSADPVRQTQNFVSFGNGGYDQTSLVSGLNVFRRGTVLGKGYLTTSATGVDYYVAGASTPAESYVGATTGEVEEKINASTTSSLWASDGNASALTPDVTTTVSAGGTTAPAAFTCEAWTVASGTGFLAPQTFVIDPAAPTEVILVQENLIGTLTVALDGYPGTRVADLSVTAALQAVGASDTLSVGVGGAAESFNGNGGAASGATSIPTTTWQSNNHPVGDPVSDTTTAAPAATAWTVVRGALGTTPVAHASGFTVQQVTHLSDLVTTAVQETVAQTYNAAATSSLAPMVWFEGPENEPSGSAAFIAASSAAFIEAVHTTAGAKALVPTLLQPFSLVTFLAGSNYLVVPTLTAVLTTLKGLGVEPDGVSIHPYNMIEGDLAEVDQTFPIVLQAMESVGWGALPLFGTENGDVWLEWVDQKITRALNYMALWLMAAECYLPGGKETMHWFYDQSHGFNYFSWWVNGDDSLVPIWPMVRTWSARLYGTTFQERYSFPGIANRMFIGARWTDATYQTILILPAGLTEATVTLNVSGATSATLYDWADTSSTANVTNGKLTYTATRLGTWVVLPVAATVSIADVNDGLLNLGPNMAAPDHAATALGTSSTVLGDQTTIYQLVGDDPQCGDRTGLGLGPWADSTWTLPSTLTITPPTPCRADRVVLLCPPPYFTRTAPVAFSVEYLPVGSTTWETVYTETNPTATVQALPGAYSNMGSGAAPTYRTTYDGKCHFDCSFDPVVGQAFRIVVTATSYGGEPNLEAANACLATNDVPTGPPSAVGAMFVARHVGLYCRSAQIEPVVFV